MPVVTIRIYPSNGGTVRVSQKLPSESAFHQIGIATASQNGSIDNDFSFGFWDNALFSASPATGWTVDKFCTGDNRICKEISMLRAEIDKNYDVLNVYFKPLPPPTAPSSDWFIWLWKWVWGKK